MRLTERVFITEPEPGKRGGGEARKVKGTGGGQKTEIKSPKDDGVVGEY